MKNRNKHPEYLFVYGSLRRDAKHRVFSRVESHLNYIGNGYFSGMLFDLGNYPGAVEANAKDGIVKGEVYEIEDRRNEVMRILDRYEGFSRESKKKSLFIRKRADIKLKNGKTVSGWVYLYNRPDRIQKAKRISSGDYLRFKKKITHA